MNYRIVCQVAILALLTGCGRGDKPSKAPVQPVTDTYFGVRVEDPYRYMENMDDTVFLGWMKEYADYSRKVLDEIPGRQELIDAMKDFDKRKSDKAYSLFITENNRYFYLKFTPEDETGKLCSREGFEGEEKLVYDPDTFTGDQGSRYVISSVSPDYYGEKVAVSVAPNGSENSTMIIVDTECGTIHPERIENVFSQAVWLHDSDMFLYSKANSGDVHDRNRLLDTRILVHRMGEPAERDRLVFSSEMFPDIDMRPEEIPYIYYDRDENDFYLILKTVERYLKVYHAHAENFKPGDRLNWKVLFRQSDEVQAFYPMGNALFIYTANDAPGFRVIKTSKNLPDLEHAQVVIPEPGAGMISGLDFASSGIYYSVKLNGVEESLYRMPYGGEVAEEISLPARAGSMAIRTRGHKYDDIWINISGWSMDGARYRYHSDDGSFTREQLSSKADFPEYDDLVVEELMIPSYDGVMVPLSIMYMKGTKKDGEAPLLLTGYGAYGSSQIPRFNPYLLLWTKKGGIYAVAHVRGGGELGESWRLAGQKTTKPNTWKDFIACSEYLVNQQYTGTDKLAIYGGSAGGILIGRAMTERPDLYAAAIPMVGIMNPLRAEQSPNGPVNAPEFGTVKDSVECMALMEMDAYLKVKDGEQYPATLITAGFNDPRVIVWQPAKFAARLQAANSSRNPILLDVDYSSGHGVGDTKTKGYEDLADLFVFAFWQTGHPEFQK